eukprot:TRINITY_DN22120_c0_g1_i1.p1 TRINITY_DN22120_c0_g1~~TRINITY_DN22120_c0_g1_i1.p1  ORF type:complete len:225 (-),score=43.88 TRINITY_DN22120_c0_g1_i1:14-688(-)
MPTKGTKRALAETNSEAQHTGVLQSGVVHLKGLLSPEDQNDLIEAIKTASTDYTPTPARNAKSHFMKLMAYNCKKQKDSIPAAILTLGAKATEAAHQLSDVIPEEYTPDYITSFRYPVDGGKLTSHIDKVLGWVVLFSLGCTAKFSVKGKEMAKTVTLDFESGDVLVFNGGTEWGVWHSIKKIVPDTCPKHLQEHLADARMSLQVRQSKRNDNFPPAKRPKKGN